MTTSFIDAWEGLKKQAPFDRVSMLLNGRRRYLADWLLTHQRSPKKTKSVISALREYLRYLITPIPSSISQAPVAVIYGLRLANCAEMIEKVVARLKPEIEVTGLDSIRPYAFRMSGLEVFGFNFWFGLLLSLRHYLAAVRDIIRAPVIFKDIGLVRVMLSLLPQSALLVFYQEYLRKAGVRVLLVSNDTVEYTELWCAAAVLEKIPVVVMQHGMLSEVVVPSFATKFFVWGEYSYEDARRLGFAPPTLEITGAACLNAPKQMKAPLSSGNRLRFLFFSQANTPELSGPESCQQVRDWLFDVARRRPGWEFVIRLHPAELDEKFYDFSNRPPNIIIEYPQAVKLGDSIAISNICGTIWSGAGLDGMLMERPLVQFLGQGWLERASWYRYGIPRVASADELLLILDKLSQDQDYQKEIIAIQSRVINETFSNFCGEETVALRIREYLDKE